MGDSDTLGMAIFRCAAGALGGPHELAASLGVTHSELPAWIDGVRRPPFDSAVRALQMTSYAPAVREAKRHRHVAAAEEHNPAPERRAQVPMCTPEVS